MSSIPVAVKVDGRECDADCPFFDFETCLLFGGDLSFHGRWGGEEGHFRCDKCLAAFGRDNE